MHDDVLFQLNGIAKRLQQESRVIDPVEFGEIKGAVTSLQLQMTEFKARQAVTDAKLDLVLDKLSEAKGGWRILMLLGGAASTLGAAITWLATHYPGAHP